LIHYYFGIDLEEVWDNIKKNLLPFKEQHILKVLTAK
jgi:uncharacterized protein with HEPN domain